MSKYNWNKEDLEKICNSSKSFKEVLGKIGLRSAGGNYQTLKSKLFRYQISVEHFENESWNKNYQSLKLEEYKCPKAIKKWFIKSVKYQCVECGLTNWYNGKPLKLQVDHIDGNRLNNKFENLRLMCANCHSQTPTFGNNNRSKF